MTASRQLAESITGDVLERCSDRGLLTTEYVSNALACVARELLTQATDYDALAEQIGDFVAWRDTVACGCWRPVSGQVPVARQPESRR